MSDNEIVVKVDYEAAVGNLKRKSADIYTSIKNAVISEQKALFSLVQDKLDGPVLNVRTGKLRRSIQRSDIIETGATIEAYVYSDSSVRYARIHEYGGTINHPGSSKFQAWQDGGEWRYSHYTKPHQIVMPERSFMRSALAERAPDIREALAEAVAQ